MAKLRILACHSFDCDKTIDSSRLSDMDVFRFIRDQITRIADGRIELVSLTDAPNTGSISEKLRAEMERCDGLFCLFASRVYDVSAQQELTSSYVLTEGAYATALYSKQTPWKGIFGIIETGVNRSQLGIGFTGDWNIPEFSRSNLDQCLPALQKYVAGMLAHYARDRVMQLQVVPNPDSRSQEPLAGIVVLDIVSYSSLVRDVGEVGTVSKVRQFLERSSQFLKSHRATVVKYVGDGIFAVFENSSDAFDFAITLQESLAERPIYAGERPIQARIAVHVGPVVVKDTDYGRDAFGGGIVVAARMEPHCKPGGVIISEQLRRVLRPDLVRGFVQCREIDMKHGAKQITWEVSQDTSVAAGEHQ